MRRSKVSRPAPLAALLYLTLGGAALSAACSGGGAEATAGPEGGDVHPGGPGGGAGHGAGVAGGSAGAAGKGLAGGSGSSGKGLSAGGSSGSHALVSLSVEPAAAKIDLGAGMAAAPQPFKAIGHYADGSTTPLPMAGWTVDHLAVGAIDDKGKYTAAGAVGGVVTVTASSGGQAATAQLTVTLHVTQAPAGLSPSVQMALRAATTPDPAARLAYPYDGTVFPRGLAAPLLMWNGGAATDVLYLHLTSPGFSYEGFVPAAMSASPPPAGQTAIDAATWTAFTQSTAGKASFTMARHDGTSAVVIASQSWTVASATTSGSIYYWSNSKGRVLRVKPSAAAPDDFTQPLFPNPTNSCTMTCHTVSANGNVLSSGGGFFGGSIDLTQNKPLANLGGVWGTNPAGQPENDWFNTLWDTVGISPDGTYVAINSIALDRTASLMPMPAPTIFGMYKSADNAPVMNSGLDGMRLGMPAFAPDGKLIAYADSPSPGVYDGLSVIDFNPAASPMAQNPRALVKGASVPSAPVVSWPTVSPDSSWVIYERGTSVDSRGACPSGTCDYSNRGELYIANVVTGAETPLTALNGDSYPFVAGAARDASWNFEPTFAPVAAGGYFWVVFTSRRTYGNAVLGASVGGAEGTQGPGVTKQLWVSAIDEQPVAGKDPSHPPFLLAGQDLGTLNMRGFWALDPCKKDGQGCGSGTECCGGYCSGGGTAPTCTSKLTAMCASDGDRCQKSADCCSSGARCINSFCDAMVVPQ